jgi:hypothetical protein
MLPKAVDYIAVSGELGYIQETQPAEHTELAVPVVEEEAAVVEGNEFEWQL